MLGSAADLEAAQALDPRLARQVWLERLVAEARRSVRPLRLERSPAQLQ